MKPAFEEFIQPSKKARARCGRDARAAVPWSSRGRCANGARPPTLQYADVIVPRAIDNVGAIDLIVTHIRKRLAECGNVLRDRLARRAINPNITPASLIVLPSTPQILGVHSIIRDKVRRRLRSREQWHI